MKGKLVYVEGRIQTRSWEDKEGVKRYTTEIIASDMRMLDSKGQTKSGETSFDADAANVNDGSVPLDDVPF